ncbi:MAG: AraC family transcriptional regulator [Clostridia bacterium]|nr:AraC family transcriptional regulator [Clostridia bacterium]
MNTDFEKIDKYIIAHRLSGNRHYHPVFHNHIELIYVLKGSFDIFVDGKTEVLYPNEMSIGFPYAIHSIKKSPGSEAIMIMFHPEIAYLYRNEISNFKPEIPFLKEADIFFPLLENVVSNATKNERMAVSYLNVIIGELLQRIKLVKPSNVDMSFAERILSYCSEHFKENLSINSIASALFISESYVSKIFSQKLGYPFREYLNMLRISEAKRLLKTTDLKITDVMYDCGFKNQSSFNRIFLTETGMTPRNFKDKCAQASD